VGSKSGSSSPHRTNVERGGFISGPENSSPSHPHQLHSIGAMRSMRKIFAMPAEARGRSTGLSNEQRPPIKSSKL